jgi:hypothetical protein
MQYGWNRSGQKSSGVVRGGEQPPVLFLIDEIFSGTNSGDRRLAEESVVQTLLERGAGKNGLRWGERAI